MVTSAATRTVTAGELARLARAPVPQPTPRKQQPPPTRGERVARFLHRVRGGMLEHLRYLSAVYAGEVLGTTVGAVAFAPLAFQSGNLYLLTGGSALAGGLGALAAYGLEKYLSDRRASAGTSTQPRGTVGMDRGESVLAVGAALRALPDFTYPTIEGATEAERQKILSVLDRLPLGAATSVGHIEVVDGLGRSGASGVAHPTFSHTRIFLDRESLAVPRFDRELVTHEVGHAVDMNRGFGPLAARSNFGPFGKPPYVSSYAGTNRFEDFAESHVAYYMDREAFRARFPEKYAAMEQATRPDLAERLMDRPRVREAGKAAAEALGKVPHLRTALELAGALIAPLQIHRGARQVEEGDHTGDAATRARGKMNLASGLVLLFPGGPFLALAITLGRLTLSSQVRRGAVKPETAEKVADGMLAVAAGPVGMMGLAALSELQKAGVDLKRVRPVDHPERPSSPFLKGLLSTVGGAFAGSLAGAAIGTAVAGPMGAAVGSFWGRLGGAALGLGTYGVYRGLKSSDSAPDDPMALTPGDKKFLALLGGGALLGGAAGGTLGWLGGQAVGAALGGALAGPAGAAVGGMVGRLSGMMGGSLALAKAGAALGRRLAPEEERVR